MEPSVSGNSAISPAATEYIRFARARLSEHLHGERRTAPNASEPTVSREPAATS